MAGLLWLVSNSNPPDQDHSPKHYTPQFHAKQCFVSNHMPREPWQPAVDGIVEMVGYAHYLVLFYSEADRRGWTKTGWQEEMQTFDKKYHPITCPAGWVYRKGS